MIFENGYPRVNGSSDFEDSSHLAGILAITNYENTADCRRYIKTEYGVLQKHTYVRCENTKYDFSRDQFILLAAGLIKQGYGDLVDLDYVTGRDIMPPSVRGVARIATGKKAWWFQGLWLKAEILWHSYVQPLEESNQIIALCSVYGDEYLKLWTKHNKLWKWSIYRYWSQLDGSWRDEKELSEHVIKYVENKI